MHPTADIMNCKKPGFGSWTSFEDCLAEYKENELRKEWWYYVSEEAPYTTRNERRRNKKLGIFIQPIKRVKPAAARVAVPVESVVESVVESEPVVKPVLSEPVVEVESETLVAPEPVEVESEPVVEAVAEVESETVVEVVSETVAEVESEVESETLAEPVQAVAEVESETVVEVVSETVESEVESESEAVVAEVETVAVESEAVEVEAVIEAVVESDTVEIEPEMVPVSDIAEAEEAVELVPEDMLITETEQISDFLNKETNLALETESIIEPLEIEDTLREVLLISEIPVIVLDAACENAPVAEPVTGVKFATEAPATELVVEVPAIEEAVAAVSEVPMDVDSPISDELQVTEAESVTEATPISAEPESEDLSTGVKDTSLIQNMYAQTQPPPSYFDDMKTH